MLLTLLKHETETYQIKTNSKQVHNKERVNLLQELYFDKLCPFK